MQVDDRATENLWVRMVQTPFPYGGGLIRTEVSLGHCNVTICDMWIMTYHDMWIAQFAIAIHSHSSLPIAVCPLKVPARLRVSWEFLSAGHHTSDRHVPASHWSNSQNLQELKQQERLRDQGKQPHSLWGATWLWWEHKVWILEVLLQDQQAGILCHNMS